MLHYLRHQCHQNCAWRIMNRARSLVIIAAIIICISTFMYFFSNQEYVTPNWGIQKHFKANDREAPPHLESNSLLKWWEGESLIMRYMERPILYRCKEPVWYGPGYQEGAWLVCHDEPFKPKPGCIVYSFGIGNLWQFDEKAERLGCSVYAFDPSMNKPDHKHSKRVWFYDMGLGGKDSNTFIPIKDGYVTTQQMWKMRTYKTILKMLNHENKIVDIFKMDIEGNEIQVLHNLLETDALKNVKQFILEYHIIGNRLYEMGQLAMDMKRLIENAGFLPFNIRQKIHYKNHADPEKFPKYRWQADVGYINSRFTNLSMVKNQ